MNQPRSASNHRRFWAFLVMSAALAFCDRPLTADEDIPLPVTVQQQKQLDARVGQLIQQLGAAEFASRERAQAELQRMGLTAFDALHEAQNDEDIEIATRARYLVRSMSVHWWVESDSLDVRKILKDYGSQRDEERKSRMEQLARLESFDGVPALCRLLRFETSIVLSKQAAILILQGPVPDDDQQTTVFCETILGAIGLSKRASADWMRAYTQTLRDPATNVDLWEQLAQDEMDVLTQYPNQSSRQIVRDLLRWRADLLARLDRQDDSLAVVRQTVELTDGTREQLLETIEWLMDRQAWSVVDEVAGRYPDRFEQFAQLTYRLAEAQRKRQEEALARVTAEQAFKIAPEDDDEHIRAGYTLQERGMFDWAEREYRYVSERGPPESFLSLNARYMLSEMLHDQHRHVDAAQVLQAVVDAMDKDTDVQKAIDRTSRGAAATRSRMHYFYAMGDLDRNDSKAAMARLQQGWEADPLDPDVLIGMFRVPDADAAWQQQTRERIKTATENYRAQIEQCNQHTEDARTSRIQDLARQELAKLCNLMAWLVSNTEGDFDEALRCSQRSLEIRPDSPGYLDTLGRCFYAKGDYANAVRYQTRALQLDPHSGQLRRQLELFQEALDKASAAPRQESM